MCVRVRVGVGVYMCVRCLRSCAVGGVLQRIMVLNWCEVICMHACVSACQ